MESVSFIYTEKLHKFSISECLTANSAHVSSFLGYMAVVLDFHLQYLTDVPFT